MGRITVEFSANRELCGFLSFSDDAGCNICGPWPVAGKATSALATVHGNAARNPLFRYGDTPTGGYRIRQIVKSGKGTKFAAAEFGPYGVVIIEGISGDAAIAEANGRFRLAIKGGKLADTKELRSTAGALRLANEHQRALVGALRQSHHIQCDVIDRKRLPKSGRVFDDASCVEADPPLAAAEHVLSQLRRSPRDMLRVGASGATSAVFLGFSVTFIAFDAAPARASADIVAPDEASPRKPDKIVVPEIKSSHSFARMAYEAPVDHKSTPPPPASTLDRLKDMGERGLSTGRGFDGGKTPTDAIVVPSTPNTVPAPSQPVPPAPPASNNATGGGTVTGPPTQNASPSPAQSVPQTSPVTPSKPGNSANDAYERYLEKEKAAKKQGEDNFKEYQKRELDQKSANEKLWQKYKAGQAKTPADPKALPHMPGAPDVKKSD